MYVRTASGPGWLKLPCNHVKKVLIWPASVNYFVILIAAMPSARHLQKKDTRA